MQRLLSWNAKSLLYPRKFSLFNKVNMCNWKLLQPLLTNPFIPIRKIMKKKRTSQKVLAGKEARAVVYIEYMIAMSANRIQRYISVWTCGIFSIFSNYVRSLTSIQDVIKVDARLMRHVTSKSRSENKEEN